MADSRWVVILLGVMSVSTVAMTVALLMTTNTVRRTLKQISAMLPSCNRTLHETRRTLGQAQQLLTRTNHATRDVVAVIHQACDVASEAIEQVVSLKGKAKTFLAARFGNGAGSGPRRRYRG